MADTTTAHFGWVKPDPGADANIWGNTLNATTDAIDAQVFTVANATVPIGTIIMFAGSTAPAGWLICNGASLATTGTYAALFAVTGYAFGGSGTNFNLPNLFQKFPIGANGTTSLGVTGGEATHVLAAAEMPAHTHTITVTPSDPGHAHSIADGGHAHSISDPGHNHSQSPHGHGVNDPGHVHGGVPVLGYLAGSIGGSATLGTYTNTASATTGVTIQANNANIAAAATGIATVATGTGIGIVAHATGITATATAANTGGGGGHNNLPPYVYVNYIIRYQ